MVFDYYDTKNSPSIIYYDCVVSVVYFYEHLNLALSFYLVIADSVDSVVTSDYVHSSKNYHYLVRKDRYVVGDSVSVIVNGNLNGLEQP